MIVLKGIGVFADISFGTLLTNTNNNENIPKIHINDTEKELQRYYLAKDLACQQIRKLYEEALKDFGASEADIFATPNQMYYRANEYIEASYQHIVQFQKSVPVSQTLPVQKQKPS